MSASDHLSQAQFSFTPGQRFVSHHQVEARIGDQPVGKMEWYVKTGHVMNIEVDKDHRRQGIGRGLWEAGQQAAAEHRGVVAPKHSAQRTDDGQAWARSVGGRLPRRVQ